MRPSGLVCAATVCRCGLLLILATPALGQQISAEDYYRLQDRLMEQESRLRQLEAQQFQSNQEPQLYDVNASTNIERRLSTLEELYHGLGKGEPALDGPTQKWSGRVHFDYWPFPAASALVNQLEEGDPTVAPEDFIGFRRLRFGVAGDVTDTMLYKIEMEFAAPNNLTFKDAYLGWDELPFLGTVLLGNQKRPYGLDHLNSSRYNVFLERPFHVEAFNQDARRLGVQAYNVSDNERWNWRYGYFLMDDLAAPGGQRTDNYQSELAARLANTIWYDESSGGRGYAHWAVSGSLAFPGGGPDARFRTRPEGRTANRWLDTGRIDNGTRYQLIGFEGVVNVGAFSVVSEIQYATMDRTASQDLDFGGGYIYVAYFLTGEHTPWSRSRGTLGRTKPFENFFLVDRCNGGCGGGWGAWQIAGRYSYADYSDAEIFGGVGNSFTLGLNWWWNPYARVQFNYIYGTIDERADVGGAPLVAGLPTSGDYNIFGSRFMVDF